MGDEYFAELDANDVSLAVLSERIEAVEICCIETVASSNIKLRWRGQSRREKWREDVVLAYWEGGLLLTIHGGTRSQIEALLEVLTSAVSEMVSKPVTFGSL